MIAREIYPHDCGISFAKLLDDAPGIVLRAIVHQDDFKTLAGDFSASRREALVEIRQACCLVVTGDDGRDAECISDWGAMALFTHALWISLIDCLAWS